LSSCIYNLSNTPRHRLKENGDVSFGDRVPLILYCRRYCVFAPWPRHSLVYPLFHYAPNVFDEVEVEVEVAVVVAGLFHGVDRVVFELVLHASSAVSIVLLKDSWRDAEAELLIGEDFVEFGAGASVEAGDEGVYSS
jgi:hypothetical protein